MRLEDWLLRDLRQRMYRPQQLIDFERRDISPYMTPDAIQLIDPETNQIYPDFYDFGGYQGEE